MRSHKNRLFLAHEELKIFKVFIQLPQYLKIETKICFKNVGFIL